MFLNAMILEINPGRMLVRDLSNNNEVLVHYRNAGRFSRGDCVRITHTGAMTFSIPPQITAISIQRTQGCVRPPDPPSQSRPSEMRATIIQRQRGGLLVRNMRDNRQMFVRTPFSHHFCPRQRIIVTYNTIIMNNPPEVTAIDISQICWKY